MQKTTYDIKDVDEKLTKIDESTAREFIEGDVPVIIRVRSREFQRVENIKNLEQLKRLKEMSVYDMLQYYLD